tara:strand:+ start:450 stop:968 length:519 start_codon:yes stop_codon:yes gene_type:complete
MSSILKVDQLQDSGGNNLITSNGSGVITAAGFGKIGQVVQSTTASQVSFTSTTSYADTNLSASITPSSTSSKILIQVSQMFRVQRYGGDIRILRDSTSIFQPTGGATYTYYADPSTNINYRGYACLNYLDSPSSTSAITYKTQGIQHNSGGAFIVQDGNYFTSTITLMEILP